MHRIALAFALLLACLAAAAPASAQPQRVGVCLERVDANGSNQCSDISATNPFPVTGGGGSSSLGYVSATLLPWTSATAANATQLLMPLNTTGFGAAIAVQLDQTSTIVAGAVTYEGTYDGTNWVSVPVAYTQSPGNVCSLLTNPYTLVASTNQSFLILPSGYQSVRIRLSTQITGTGSVTPFVTLLPFLPVDPALCNPGKVGIDQTTMGTTNGVVGAGVLYETIAASQTAQVMGGTGATGDYLSHCVLYPTSTSPGVLTVFDNTSTAANNVIAFAGGSSSLSNLVPFAIPVGAVSLNGPWKVTTGANMVATCHGKFSP